MELSSPIRRKTEQANAAPEMKRDSAGRPQREATVPYAHLASASEVFATNSNAGIVPVTRIEDRNLQPGPVAAKARKLYWDWAHG